MRGVFITLEGIEGAGKSTLAARLRQRLEAGGRRVVLTREPGGTPLAERIRSAVLDRGTEQISPVSETLLMFAARAIHVDNLIRPAVLRGDWVVCDRFTDATRSYQGAGRGVSGELIESLAILVHGDLTPDLTLLLDLPPELGLQRSRARGTVTDRIESETLAFFARVRAHYLGLAVREPARFVVLPVSELGVDALCDAAWNALQERLRP
jgi:dTMP kinase